MKSLNEMITLLILLTIIIGPSLSFDRKCVSGCLSNKLCITKCDEYSRSPKRNYLSAPYCGLSRLEGNVTQDKGVGRRTPGKPLSSWPWIVSLQYQGQPNLKGLRPHFCTGVIISENFILSSAHCVPKDPVDYQVMIGSYSLSETEKNAQIIEVENILVPGILYKPWIKRHEQFGREQGKNDDLLLIKTATKMSPEIKGNEFVVNSVCLPEVESYLPYKQDWPNKPSGVASIAGWGYYGVDNTPVGKMMEVENPFIPIYKASAVFKETRHYFGTQGEYFVYNLTLEEKDLCTMASVNPGTGVREPWIFNGDSGSPVVQVIKGRTFLFGVSHWISKGQNPVSIWVRISFYNKWLGENMKKTLWEL